MLIQTLGDLRKFMEDVRDFPDDCEIAVSQEEEFCDFIAIKSGTESIYFRAV